MEATSALSAFEMASWDLIGKQLGAPVHDLIGGEQTVELYGYSAEFQAPQNASLLAAVL